MDYKTQKNIEDDMDYFDEGKHKDSHTLTPGVYTNSKESRGKHFMSALKTKLSPRAKTKSIHTKVHDSNSNEWENTETPTDESSKTKSPKQKVKSGTEKTKAASEKTKTLATNAAHKTKSAAQNIGDQTSEAAKNCWTEIKHKGSDVQGKLDEMAPRRRYSRLGSESD